MTRHFFPGMMVLCWDFIDFNKTRLSAAGWTTDDAKGEEEEDNRVVNIKIAFFSVVGGKRVVSCAFCRRARVICLLCSEEERESIPMQHTGRAFNPCYLKYEKEKERRVLSMSLLGETRRNQRREKREPTRETPQNTFVYRGGGLFFCPSSLCSSSYVVVV